MKKLLLVSSLILWMLLLTSCSGWTSVKSSTNSSWSNTSSSSDTSNVSDSAQKNADAEADKVMQQLLSE